MLEAGADAFVQRGDATANFGSASQVVVKNAPTSSTTGNSAVASRESTKLAAPALEFARVVLDSDGDGYEDAFETANGSNPFNASSIPLKITGAEFHAGAFAVTTSGLSPFIPNSEVVWLFVGFKPRITRISRIYYPTK